MEVTYYDEGNDFFQVQYNATGSNYKQATINKSNSLTWVTTTVCIDDASFKKAQNGGCDFRIWGRGNSGTTISSIKLTKQSVNPDAETSWKENRGNCKFRVQRKILWQEYQGWFGTGGPYNSWQHYAYGDADADGNCTGQDRERFQ